MSFLAPLAFWTAAIVGPALIILYFLKLRRRQEFVPSTLLWRRAVQDLQVNAPFQRLRKNLLLFLQLLVLAGGVIALARPIIETSIANERSVVMLIDVSASMNTLERQQTRLEMAKEQAANLLKTFNKAGSRWLSFFGGVQDQTRVMVIAFAERAQIISPFTTDTRELISLVDGLKPTDERTNMSEALELAEAYMAQSGIEQAPETAEKSSKIVLFSDGCIGGVENAVVRAGSLTLFPIGSVRDNVGITSIRTQRNPERPESLSIFLQVENFGPEPIETLISIFVDGNRQNVESLTLGPARPKDGPDVGSGEPGQEAERSSRALTYEFALDRAAVVEARLMRDDAFLTDNSVYAIVPAPRKMRVLLVTKGNLFLEAVVQNLALESYEVVTPPEYESRKPSEFHIADGQPRYDVVILDKHDTDHLPANNYVMFGCAPMLDDIVVAGEIEDHTLQWWDDTHAILRNVSLEYVYAARGLVIEPPAEAEVLAEGPRGAEIFRYAKDGRNFLVVSFAVEDSTWWSKPGFPIFLVNAVRYMGSAGALTEGASHRPGDSLRIPLPANVSEATVSLPSGERTTIQPDATGIARFAGARTAGLYHVEPGIDGSDRFALNLESAAESDIVPQTTFPIGVEIEVGQAATTATPEVWRWFIGAALLLVFIEWYIYNRRVMV